MPNKFIPMVYAVLKDYDIDVSHMTTGEAVEKFYELRWTEGNDINSYKNKGQDENKIKKKSFINVSLFLQKIIPCGKLQNEKVNSFFREKNS